MASIYPNAYSYTDPDITSNYAAMDGAARRATAKVIFVHAKKNHLKVKNMNKALSEVFLQPIPEEYTQEFKEARLRDTNQSFW